MRTGLPHLALICLLALSGCVSVPVAAKSNRGENFMGSASATPFSGTFEATSLSGVRCWGKYNPWISTPDLPITFQMSDGRTGHAIILRDATGMSGFGTGLASDGSKFTFFMGRAINEQIKTDWQ